MPVPRHVPNSSASMANVTTIDAEEVGRSRRCIIDDSESDRDSLADKMSSVDIADTMGPMMPSHALSDVEFVLIQVVLHHQHSPAKLNIANTAIPRLSAHTMQRELQLSTSNTVQAGRESYRVVRVTPCTALTPNVWVGRWRREWRRNKARGIRLDLDTPTGGMTRTLIVLPIRSTNWTRLLCAILAGVLADPIVQQLNAGALHVTLGSVGSLVDTAHLCGRVPAALATLATGSLVSDLVDSSALGLHTTVNDNSQLRWNVLVPPHKPVPTWHMF